MSKPEPVSPTNKEESDVLKRVGTSPRIVAAVSVYIDQRGNYSVTLADHKKRVTTRNPKEVVNAITKFLNEELEKDFFPEDGEE